MNREEVGEFTYLDSLMTKKNATEKDITNRLKKAKLLFFSAEEDQAGNQDKDL